MLNIQKCMFVLQLRCTLHSAAWESTVSGASSHTGTQLSSPQRPHNPQAQHSVIPAHQMLCSDWQCWKTHGTSLPRLTLRHALGVCPDPALCPQEGAVLAQECVLAQGQGWSCSQPGQERGVRHCPLAPPSAPGWGHSAPRMSLPSSQSTESLPELPPGADVPGLPSQFCLCRVY